MSILDGHQVVLDELRHVASNLTNAELESVLADGADIIVFAVRGAITESRTGTLAASIDHQPFKDSMGMGDTIGVDIGWQRMQRPGGSKASRTDIYGPVLEYSEKRVLRHMQAGYEISAEYASDYMVHRANELINKK